MADPLEFQTEIRPVKTHRRCDECDGEMVSTGYGIRQNFSSSWEHKCSGCGQRVWLSKSYPAVEFIDVEEF